MKFWKSVFVLCLCLLSGCGAAGGGAPVPGGASQAEEPQAGGETAQPAAAEPTALPSLAEDEEAVVTAFRIVDGAEDGELLLAKLQQGPGGDVYRLNVSAGGSPAEPETPDRTAPVCGYPSAVPILLDGKPAAASDLEDGMAVEVSWSGVTLETFPAQMGQVYQIAAWSLGTEKNPGGSCYDLCGLYLQVLDDLWKEDPGLNEGISIAGLDLSQAPGELTESEKAAIAWRFGEMHGVEVAEGTFQELEDQGYFTATAVCTPDSEEGKDACLAWNTWEDGCLFSIGPNEKHEGEVYSLPTLFFHADKWRSPLGAYGFYDCSAAWPELGTWSGYTVGAEMIS